MNYQKIYELIIQKAKFKNRIRSKEFYFEQHHIMPKCLEGDNKQENLVFLTPKEHFICHKLLTYIYPNNSKIMFGFQMMLYTHQNLRKIKISSRDYAYLKELRYKNGLPEETKEKMRAAAKKRKPQSEETKIKRSKSLIGKKRTIQTKEKMKATWKTKSIYFIIKNQQFLDYKTQYFINKEKQLKEKRLLERQNHFANKPVYSKLFCAK